MANQDNNEYLGQIGLILLGIIIAITFIPLIIGVLIALLIGATGLTYFLTVIGIATLIWFIAGLLYLI